MKREQGSVRWAAVVVLSLLLPWASLAGEPAPGGDPLQVIVTEQTALRDDLDAGKTEMTTRQINAIRKAQKDVFAVTQGKSRLDELSIDEKIQLENALERINAEVGNTRASHDGKDVCWRERVSGTGVKKTRCGTEAEMREAREGARDFMERPKVCGERCS